MRIIYIHGIGAQNAPESLKNEWDTAILGHDAGERSRMAYWADILHPRRTDLGVRFFSAAEEQAEAEIPWKESIEALAPDTEAARVFARRLFDRIAQTPVPQADIDTVLAGAPSEPGLAKALPNEWLRRPATWALTRLFIHDVAAYFYEEGIRDQIEERLESILRAGDRRYVLVSHSLGTVISYEVLHRLADTIEVPVWVTLGSPLGIDEVQDHVRQPLEVPPGVLRWLNFADRLDPVALDPGLANDFVPGDRISDLSIKNSYRLRLSVGGPHAALGYLSDGDVRASVRQGA